MSVLFRKYDDRKKKIYFGVLNMTERVICQKGTAFELNSHTRLPALPFPHPAFWPLNNG